MAPEADVFAASGMSEMCHKETHATHKNLKRDGSSFLVISIRGINLFDDVLDSVYEWLCQRREYSAIRTVWAFRRAVDARKRETAISKLSPFVAVTDHLTIECHIVISVKKALCPPNVDIMDTSVEQLVPRGNSSMLPSLECESAQHHCSRLGALYAQAVD